MTTIDRQIVEKGSKSPNVIRFFTPLSNGTTLNNKRIQPKRQHSSVILEICRCGVCGGSIFFDFVFVFLTRSFPSDLQ